MNTSAKVIKEPQSLGLTALPIPAIGDPLRTGPATGEFIVPVLDPSTLHMPDSAIPFLPDLSPEDVLQDANHQASRIIAEAEENKALMEQAALEKAQREAMLAFEDEVASRISEVRERFAETLLELSNLSAEIVSHVESDLVELAMQIAKKVVRREVSVDRDIALTLVRVSLSKLNQRTAAKVHLNPEDLSFVQKHNDELDFRGTLELIEDPSISVGGCLIHTENGDVDARIESQFDEIAFGLLA